MKQTSGTAAVFKIIPSLDARRYPNARRFSMFVSDATILQLAGSSYERLAALAF